jgi:glycerol-3-phosphate O-acyltransferase
VALAATAIQHAGEKPQSMLELKSAVLALMRQLDRRGSIVHVPRSDEDSAVTFGIRMLLLRGVITERDGLLQRTDRDQGLLAFYANSIAHLVAETPQAAERPTS